MLLRDGQHRRSQLLEVDRAVDFGASEPAYGLRPTVSIPSDLVDAGHHRGVVGEFVFGGIERGRAPFVGPVQLVEPAPEFLAVHRDVREVLIVTVAGYGAVDRGGQLLPLSWVPGSAARRGPNQLNSYL